MNRYIESKPVYQKGASDLSPPFQQFLLGPVPNYHLWFRCSLQPGQERPGKKKNV